MQNMGKNIKSYATTQVHFPTGKGGKPYGKTSKCPNLSVKKNMIRLNRTHSFPNLQAKSFKCMFCTLANFQQIKQNLLKFTHIVQELHEICTICKPIYIVFQAPAPAENPQEFQRFTQILCSLPT